MNTAGILGTVALILAAVVAFATAADILMSEKQKRDLNDRIIQVWNWLDDRKTLPYLSRLRDYAFQVPVALAAQAAAFLLFVALVGGEWVLYIGWGVSFLIATFVVMPALLQWASRAASPLTFFIRLAPVAGVRDTRLVRHRLLVPEPYRRHVGGTAPDQVLSRRAPRICA